ncbi:alkene reductase [Bacterioplanes sanyensis]|uniref:Alkene reductase n=1 Tax=Bacterioplanes sanyensis TaxID=1249553 RepID=A0A222FLI6_9GAMM|nr:alkene reductase [Bacterioplanes sanyensis]ASP39083.1 alkene reductase [Bacterioplanes sanyensis]
MSEATELLSPVTLGALQLNNRVLMAPLTRVRAEADHVPGDLMAQYYAQRASAGLIIAEATMAMADTSAFISEPGIYSAEQIAGWRKVTDAVHKAGGKIILQLWHGGRASHPDLNGGKTPVAASAVAIDGEVHTPAGKQPYTVPRALADDEIPSIIEGFRQAAENAKEAGFDGVEVHGANGYLLDNFLRDGSNQRSGPYGGSLENRARLLLEVLQAVSDVWGSQRVAVRTSPLNSFNSMKDSDPIEMTCYLAQQFNQLDLAFWHLMRADFMAEQQGDVVSAARALYQGNLVSNMGYSRDEANQGIVEQKFDAVAFGVPYIANPDLVERFRLDAPLNEADPETFYVPGAKGYIDYPTLAEQ